MMIDTLNQQHAIDGHIVFTNGRGDLPKAVISNASAEAEIYLHGGHITAFQPRTAEQPVLWMSDNALFRSDKAIRGGIPVCWPWFGPHPDDASQPQHGFARISPWSVNSTATLDDGNTQLRLQMDTDTGTCASWPYSVELELCITVGTQLQVELISRNRGTQTVTIGGALHSYFNIGAIDRVTLEGLHGCDYLDQLDQHRRKRQNGPISIDAEVDRIYLDSADESEGKYVLTDPVFARRIRIARQGSRSTVVWNPWIDKAKRMADFPDAGYRTMLCVETCNTHDDVRRLAPDSEHRLVQIIGVENLR
jgi:D-hexose-6-phosphate mutarotase